MNRKKIFEQVFPKASNTAIKFGEFKKLVERADFSDIDDENLKLKKMPLWGDESLIEALNISADDPETIAEMAAAIPAFALFFSPQEKNKSKAIDLMKAEVEAMKKSISIFEKSFMTGITGKEEAKSDYEPTIPGMDKAIGTVNVTQGFINNVVRVFSKSITGGGSAASIDDFVAGKEGKSLMKLLKGLRVDAPLSRIIDSIFNPVINKMQMQDFGGVMKSLDTVDMPEITARNIEPGTINDYLSGIETMSELEMASSMDPYIRLGLFYQLCLLQQPEFISKSTSEVKGTKLSYPDFVTKGKPFEESLRTLFGRNADLSALDPFMAPLNELSLSMLESTWNTPEFDRIKATLFIPSMQVFYVSLMNFVLANALYTFLSRKGDIVVKARTAEAERTKKEENAKKTAAELAARTPSMMDDAQRGKKIAELFKKPSLKAMLSDNVVYIPGKQGYDPEKVKALKEIVYYMFGDKNSDVPSVKAWDVNKNPLDGNYDQFFSNLIKDIQTTYKIRPLSNGVGDGKVGPRTKKFFNLVIPQAVAELV